MKNFHWIWMVGAGLLSAGTAAADGGGWVNLFNGRNLDGWVQKGGKAKYSVEDGAIVGRSVAGTPNSFLCPAKEYGDFILEYDFKVDPKLNSGVQIRSKCYDKPHVYDWKGRKIKVPAGRMHGYQIEIDPDPKRARWWSAGIYDEARRGWLCPLKGDKTAEAAFTKQGATCFHEGGWNHVRIEAVGPWIRTWLNGVPRAAIRDGMTPKGLIGLQVHGIGGKKDHEGLQVAWANLRIKEIEPGTGANSLSAKEIAGGWCLLWDGRTSDGWRGAKLKEFPKTGWKMAGGELVVQAGSGAESRAGGDIVTRWRFARFELQLDFKITPGANSGIKYFCQPNLDPITGSGAKAKQGSAIGLEYQILDDARHPDAKKGRGGNRTIASLYDLMAADASKAPNPPGQWNHARIVTDGTHVEHWLNGRKVLEYERGSKAFRDLVAKSKYKNIPGFGEWPDGHILLQDHGNEVHFRNVKVRVPPAAKN